MRSCLATFVAALALAGCAVAVEDETAVSADRQALIYGADDRQEIGAASATHQHWSRSVAMLVTRNMLACSGASCTLSPQPWLEDIERSERLCTGVRFRGQSTLTYEPPDVGGYCTGFLVAPDLMVTAAHCHYLDGPTCENTSFVFGYTANASGGAIPTSVPAADVYNCTSITSIYIDTGEDWALHKLDRPVAGRFPLLVRHAGAVANNLPLVIIGHPNGLPMKVSPIGSVRAISDAIVFSHVVDSFKINSGSPVFDRDTGIVEGIHVQPPIAAMHFTPAKDALGPCVTELVCSATGCPPRNVGDPPGYSLATRITRLSDRIPLIPALIHNTTVDPG